MTLTLSISPKGEANLKIKAAAAGVDFETYATRQLEHIVRPIRSLEEISGPIAEEFAKTGMTDDAFADFLDDSRHARGTQKWSAAHRQLMPIFF
jgi:hypothetical protein